MTKTISILQRVVVNYFYQVNAGFFFFGFFVLFGLPYSPLVFHLSLITGIVESQVFLASVMILWLLYNYKCINYVIKQLHQPRQNFLFCCNALPRRNLYLHMLYVQTVVFLPVLLYALAIVWVALRRQHYLCAAEVILFNLFTLSLTASLYVIVLQKRTLFQTTISLGKATAGSSKPFFLYPLYFLLKDRKQMLFVTKLFSLLILYAFIKLYEPEQYDIRPLQLCLLLTAASHAAIVFEVRAFEEEFLLFTKNLPFTLFGRFARMLAMYVCLLLPELIMLFKGIGIHFMIGDYPQLLFMLLALICLFHVALLLQTTKMDQLIQVVFGIEAACFFVLLYDPGILFPSAILLLTYALYHTYYYQQGS